MAKTHPILGRWRITHMEEWDQEYVDEEVEGFIRLDHGGSGEFHFGYVHGWIQYELTERNGKPSAELSWEGNNEMDPANGRGWAVLQDDGTLKGKLYFHQGDNSEFVAVKKGKPQRAIRRRAVLISMDKPKPGK